MDNDDGKRRISLAERGWIVFGTIIIIFSAIFLLPSIFLALTDDNRMGAYISTYFIPFLFSLLFIFIILVVFYIYWHMANQMELVLSLRRIEDKIDNYNNVSTLKEDKEGVA